MQSLADFSSLVVCVQPSFDKVVPPSFYELGLAELICIYNDLCERGKPPPVIDAAELQEDPEVYNLYDHDHLLSLNTRQHEYDFMSH